VRREEAPGIPEGFHLEGHDGGVAVPPPGLQQVGGADIGPEAEAGKQGNAEPVAFAKLQQRESERPGFDCQGHRTGRRQSGGEPCVPAGRGGGVDHGGSPRSHEAKPLATGHIAHRSERGRTRRVEIGGAVPARDDSPDVAPAQRFKHRGKRFGAQRTDAQSTPSGNGSTAASARMGPMRVARR